MKSFYIEVNNICNIKCIHCFQDSNTGEKKELPYDVFKKIVDYCVLKGLRKVSLSGGEIFLHSKWAEFVSYCHTYRLKVSLISNGTLINEDIINKILSFDVNLIELTISIDGYDETSNDYIRGNGVFKKTNNSLCLLSENNLSKITNIQTVTTSLNHNHAHKLLDYISNYCINAICFLFLKNWWRAKLLPANLGLNENEIIEFIDRIHEYKKKINIILKLALHLIVFIICQISKKLNRVHLVKTYILTTREMYMDVIVAII